MSTIASDCSTLPGANGDSVSQRTGNPPENLDNPNKRGLSTLPPNGVSSASLAKALNHVDVLQSSAPDGDPSSSVTTPSSTKASSSSRPRPQTAENASVPLAKLLAEKLSPHATANTVYSNPSADSAIRRRRRESAPHPTTETGATADSPDSSESPPPESLTTETATTDTLYRLRTKPPDAATASIHPSISAPSEIHPAPSLTLPTPESEKPPTRTSASRADKSLLDYTRLLLGLDAPADASGESDALEDAWSVATKRRGVYNLIQVPVRLERLLTFVMLICADEFLSLFTFLPIRAGMAVGEFAWRLVSLPVRATLRRIRPTSRPTPRERARRAKRRVAQVVDVLHCSLLALTAAFLSVIDISWVYHNIRGQSVIKLYVVFNVLEIFDRLGSSFGVDILDSLGWTTASAVRFLSRDAPAGSPRRGIRARSVQSMWLVSRVAFDYVFTLVYVGLHAALLLTWVVTLNVAINTKNNALVTLLVANNFVELKGAVFKSYKVQHMFQAACADGVERFQLSVFLVVMLVYTAGNGDLFATWGVVYACEVLVDWIKHAFVTKFNRIPHRVYPQFSIVICEDIANTRTSAAVRSAGASAVAKRIGFVSLPLAALVARMAAGSVRRMPVGPILFLFATLVAAKVALSIGLMGHAQRRLSRAAMQQQGEWTKEEDEMESRWYQSLVNVGRYDLISKS